MTRSRPFLSILSFFFLLSKARGEDGFSASSSSSSAALSGASSATSLSNESPNGLTLKLYHRWQDQDDYLLRGTLTLLSRDGETLLNQENGLTPEEVTSLKKASSEKGLYHLKAVASRGNWDGRGEKTATTFTRACSLYESVLSDLLSVSLDSNGNFLGISISTTNPYCIPSLTSLPNRLSTFNTTVTVIQTSVAPVPDTQTYIQRQEQEKADKLRGDRSDNRSFFAKYWMYIVPVVIFLLISSAANPDAQGGGGGGGAR